MDKEPGELANFKKKSDLYGSRAHGPCTYMGPGPMGLDLDWVIL